MHCLLHLLAGVLLLATGLAQAQAVTELGQDWPAPSPDERAFDARTFAGLDRSRRAGGHSQRGRHPARTGCLRVLQGRRHGGLAAKRGVGDQERAVHAGGRGQAQGRIASLDQTVVALMPELAGINSDPRAQQLTVRHLLTMTAGFQQSERRFFDPKGRARFAMSRKFAAAPGEVFKYEDAASNLLSAVLEKAVGETPAGFAQRHLFRPPGIARAEWQADPRGQALNLARNQIYGAVLKSQAEQAPA